MVAIIVEGPIVDRTSTFSRGSNPFARYPWIIGHKFSGIAEDVGSGVDGLAIGHAQGIAPRERKRFFLPVEGEVGDCPTDAIGRRAEVRNWLIASFRRRSEDVGSAPDIGPSDYDVGFRPRYVRSPSSPGRGGAASVWASLTLSRSLNPARLYGFD